MKTITSILATAALLDRDCGGERTDIGIAKDPGQPRRRRTQPRRFGWWIENQSISRRDHGCCQPAGRPQSDKPCDRSGQSRHAAQSRWVDRWLSGQPESALTPHPRSFHLNDSEGASCAFARFHDGKVGILSSARFCRSSVAIRPDNGRLEDDEMAKKRKRKYSRGAGKDGKNEMHRYKRRAIIPPPWRLASCLSKAAIFDRTSVHVALSP